MAYYRQWPYNFRGYYDKNEEANLQKDKDAFSFALESRNCTDIKSCDRLNRKNYNLHVPMTVEPYAQVGKPEVKCVGGARVTPGIKRCDKGFNSQFTITQKISVTIPVQFGAEVCNHGTCVEEEKNLQENC